MVADMTFEQQQMLAAHIQQADPIMHDIIEKVGPPFKTFPKTGKIRRADDFWPPGIGEDQAKAVHQPDSVRELYLAGRAGRVRESDAECVFELRR
jgi:hypothetical protein